MGRSEKLVGKKHLFFDLDHTLWDYETNSRETLTELWSAYNLRDHGVEISSFLSHFELVNNELWDRYHKGEIGKDTIRFERFQLIFERLAKTEVKSVEAIQDDYLTICPTKPHVLDGALEVLTELETKFELHLITNGFDEIQSTKLAGSGLEPFFEIVVTSGKAGYQKPQPEIFQFALDQAQANVNESVMIGDNPESDVEGAYKFGMDQVFFNPTGLKCPVIPSAEIKSLRELPALLF